MEINFINRSQNTLLNSYEALLEVLITKSLKVLNHKLDVSVSIVLVDDDEIKDYNWMYRGLNESTDVLSFPNDEPDEYLGDIIISAPTLVNQAQEYGHTTKREFSFLVVHGLLHLLGYDHETYDEEEVMFSLQKEILDDMVF